MSETPHAKFMQNVMIDPKNRTRYVKFLEKFSPDPQVSFQRILISVALFVFAIVIVMALAMAGPSGRLKYTFLPLLLVFTGMVIFIVLYIMPSRGKSMLSSVYELINFQVLERVRMKATSTGGIPGFGIKGITRDGTLKFSNGDVGALFLVEGHLGRSTLPKVAENASSAKHHYLVGRSNTVQEMLVTSITTRDLESQLRYYQDVYAKNSGNSIQEAWKRAMSELDYNYASRFIHHQDITLKQYIILRDIDKLGLDKAINSLLTSGNGAMLSAVGQITKPSRIRAILSPIVMNVNSG